MIQCTLCDATFKKRNGAQSHFRSAHPDEPIPGAADWLPAIDPDNLVCPECGRGPFKSARFLGRHLQAIHHRLGKRAQKEAALAAQAETAEALSPQSEHEAVTEPANQPIMGADTNGTGLTKAGYDGMFKKATMTGYLAARIEMLIESFCEEQDVEAGEMLFLVGGYLAGKRQGTPQL